MRERSVLNSVLWIAGLGYFWSGWSLLLTASSFASFAADRAPFPAQTEPARCPTQLEPLIELMLPDLAAYTNRVLARSRSRTIPHPIGSVITVSKPEFEPLPLGSATTASPDPTLKQVFITTLERSPIGTRSVDSQQFHWLFFTQTFQGWQLAFMYTRMGTYPTSVPPTPPRDSSQGALAQAIQLWLRDCHSPRL